MSTIEDPISAYRKASPGQYSGAYLSSEDRFYNIPRRSNSLSTRCFTVARRVFGGLCYVATSIVKFPFRCVQKGFQCIKKIPRVAARVFLGRLTPTEKIENFKKQFGQNHLFLNSLRTYSSLDVETFAEAMNFETKEFLPLEQLLGKLDDHLTEALKRSNQGPVKLKHQQLAEGIARAVAFMVIDAAHRGDAEFLKQFNIGSFAKLIKSEGGIERAYPESGTAASPSRQLLQKIFRYVNRILNDEDGQGENFLNLFLNEKVDLKTFIDLIEEAGEIKLCSYSCAYDRQIVKIDDCIRDKLRELIDLQVGQALITRFGLLKEITKKNGVEAEQKNLQNLLKERYQTIAHRYITQANIEKARLERSLEPLNRLETEWRESYSKLLRLSTTDLLKEENLELKGLAAEFELQIETKYAQLTRISSDTHCHSISPSVSRPSVSGYVAEFKGRSAFRVKTGWDSKMLEEKFFLAIQELNSSISHHRKTFDEKIKFISSSLREAEETLVPRFKQNVLTRFLPDSVDQMLVQKGQIEAAEVELQQRLLGHLAEVDKLLSLRDRLSKK